MSQFAIDQVLSQIRALQSAQRNVITPPKPAIGQGAQQPSGVSFAQVLKQGLDKVNAVQQSADAKAQSFARGTPGVELGDVMVESQKANVAFRATVEVRNRFVAAYQEIMNMQI
jgi:flagellar hook-basal body complex protein FliE